MNEVEQNTQRIMTELLAAHAQTKRTLAEIRGLELELSHAMNLLKRMRTIAVEHHEVGAIEKLSKIGWGDPCPVCDGTDIYTKITDAINAYNSRDWRE